MEPSPQKAAKKDWTLNSLALQGLISWLDQGQNSEGQKYLEMRQRLLAYFDRKNCLTPDELADETLNRVARRLEEEGTIESDTPARYCYIVARFVLMEHLRETRRDNMLSVEIQRQGNEPVAIEDAAESDKMLSCLEQCIGKLEPLNREIITRYYVGKERVKIENRRSLATSLGITMNALSIRACRIRDKLEACIKQCISRE